MGQPGREVERPQAQFLHPEIPEDRRGGQEAVDLDAPVGRPPAAHRLHAPCQVLVALRQPGGAIVADGQAVEFQVESGAVGEKPRFHLDVQLPFPRHVLDVMEHRRQGVAGQSRAGQQVPAGPEHAGLRRRLESIHTDQQTFAGVLLNEILLVHGGARLCLVLRQGRSLQRRGRQPRCQHEDP